MFQRTAALALVAVAAASCLESLPPAEECEAPARVIDGSCVSCEKPLVFVGDECRACPPPAQVAYQSCLPVVNPPPPGDGCMGDVEDGFACLTGGSPQDCSCDDDDCAEPVACYDERCPPEVLAAAPGAKCVGLTESQLSWLVPPDPDANGDSEGCVCGCMRCALQCDGRGVIIGAFEDNVEPRTRTLQGLLLDLNGLMPPTGNVGFYVRGRGWGNLAMLLSSTEPVLTNTRAGCFLPIVNDFSEPLAYGPTNECVNIPDLNVAQPYEWQEEADTPRWAMLPIIFEDDVPSAGVLEIDCIIPFYVDGS